MRKLAIDHFIPLCWGHGGSYIENMIPLDESHNHDKSGKHPFEWAESALSDEELADFIKKATHLAKLNGLTLKQYRHFIDWCYANQRTTEEVEADNIRYGYKKTSIELWKEAIGVSGPDG